MNSHWLTVFGHSESF